MPAKPDLSAVFRAIAAAHEQGRDLVTVTVVAGEHAGAHFLSSITGQLTGSVASDLDARAHELAAQAWRTRAPVWSGELFAELHAVAEPLLIFGAGHIGVALANLAQTIGFQVTVLDDRSEFADAARFAHGVDVQTLDFTAPLAGISITHATYVVLVTRAHKYDFDCLQAVLQQPERPRYVGMIGSKRRVRAAFTALLAAGTPRALLEQVHAPVGLEIGAETPEEIAVSIAAELIQVRRTRTSGGKAGVDRVLERLLPEQAAQ